MSIRFRNQNAVTERLSAVGPTGARANEALRILWTLRRHIGWQSYGCARTASQLCEVTRTDRARMARLPELPEDMGAIRRVKRGRVKVITVTPEGAFQGSFHRHGRTVERYRFDVIDGGRADG